MTAPGVVADSDEWDPLGAARLRVRLVWLTVALVAVLAVGSVYGHRLIEDDIGVKVSRALEEAGYGDVDVDLAGRRVTLTGVVPTGADVRRAAETVEAIAGIKGVTIDLGTGASTP